VPGRNREILQKLTADGSVMVTERQSLGKGFPSRCVQRGPVTTGCGHIMHYACFDHYYAATQRRQSHQIARAHPERLEKKEFVCPLCKALGNAFLPIIWKGKQESYPGELQAREPFQDWLCSRIGPAVSRLDKAAEREKPEKPSSTRYHDMFVDYVDMTLINPLADKLEVIASGADLPSLAQLGTSQALGILQLDASLGVPSVLASSTSASSGIDAALLPTIELSNIYKRLRDTMKANGLPTRHSYPAALAGSIEDLAFTDTLAKTLGFSISAVEIAQRGIASEPGSTLLDKISQQTLTLLRIVSETVSSYIAIGSIIQPGVNKTMMEFQDTHRRQLHQLFIGHPQIFDGSTFPLELKQVEPLLVQDPFVFLADCSVCIVPALSLDVHHVLRLCYLAELVKVVLCFIQDPQALEGAAPYHPHDADHSLDQLHVFERFTTKIFGIFEDASISSSSDTAAGSAPFNPFAHMSEKSLRLVRALLERYALCFLRKSVILLHTSFGIDFPNTGFADLDEPELERLSRALRLDSLDVTMWAFQEPHSPAAALLQSMTSGWIRHWLWMREGKRTKQLARITAISLSHPAIFELVGLPKNFDTLTEEAMKRKCPTTGKDLTDPSICLFCGEIFCSQAQCCSREGKIGGCNQHVEK
jgi:E3 ubiquitin-protein ligase UBR1